MAAPVVVPVTSVVVLSASYLRTSFDYQSFDIDFHHFVNEHFVQVENQQAASAMNEPYEALNVVLRYLGTHLRHIRSQQDHPQFLFDEVDLT